MGTMQAGGWLRFAFMHGMNRQLRIRSRATNTKHSSQTNGGIAPQALLQLLLKDAKLKGGDLFRPPQKFTATVSHSSKLASRAAR